MIHAKKIRGMARVPLVVMQREWSMCGEGQFLAAWQFASYLRCSDGPVTGHQPRCLVRGLGHGLVVSGGEGFSWFGCRASEGSVWRNARRWSVMIVICSPPGEPVRRCAVVGEDSGRGLFCSRDVAAGGEEVTAVVGWVRLPVTLAFTALASVVALPTTVAAGAVTCGQRGRKAEAGWMLHWAEVDGIGEGEAWSLARLELENREGGVTNTRGGLSDAGRSPNAAGARRGGVVVNRAVSRGGRRGGSVRRVGLSSDVSKGDAAGHRRHVPVRRTQGKRCPMHACADPRALITES